MSLCLSSLGIALSYRFRWSGDLVDLDSSISAHEQAVDLTSDNHVGKPGCWYNLGHSLIGRFEHSGMVADLDSAISAFKEAVHRTPDVHANNPNFYKTLGGCFVLQFQTLKKVDDSATAIWHFSQAAKLITGSSSIRFDAAVEWAHFSSTINHSSVLEAYTTAFSLLPQVVWLGQTITTRHK